VLVRNPLPPKPDKKRPVTADELDRLTNLLTEVLEKSGYVHTEGADSKIRRLVRRLGLAGHDAEIWLGMIRQIQWKLKSK
jgi:tRNA C32,U32 (ribose-2'-O)-methylase TrmJ